MIMFRLFHSRGLLDLDSSCSSVWGLLKLRSLYGIFVSYVGMLVVFALRNRLEVPSAFVDQLEILQFLDWTAFEVSQRQAQLSP